MARRLIAALLIVLLTACYSWRPMMGSPQGLLPDERPPAMRVTFRGGLVVTLQNPNLSNDSIVGSTEFGPLRLAERDLLLLEVQRFSVSKSLGFMTLNGATIAAFMALFVKALPHYYGI